MNHLLDEYFNRDLTEAEEQQLGQWLASSPEGSQRLIGMMENHYVALGLPEPQWVEQPLPRFFPKPFYHHPWFKVLCVLALAGAGYSAYRWWSQSRVPAAVPSPAPSFTPPALPKNDGPTAKLFPRKTRMELSISVDNPKAGLVTVKVLDGSGKEIRVLFAGILPAGQRTFHWDGKGDKGSVASPGDYHLEVTSGQKVMRRTIHLGAAH